MPAAFSEEFLGAAWRDDARGVGAVFTGRNHHPAIGEWSIPCFVEVCDEPRSFGWCTSDPDDPGARWRFDLEPLGGQTRLRFTLPARARAVRHDGGARRPTRARRHASCAGGCGEVRANMQRTVEGIKQLAEGAG